jgi:hypothetical protein
LPAALIRREQLLAMCRRRQRIPSDKYCARVLGFEHADQEIGKAHDGAAAVAAAAPDRLREGVEGTVGKRVAVDDEQGPGRHRFIHS